MFERHDSARLGRIAKILVLVAAIAFVTVWLAGPGSSTRGHLQKWFQSAVATLDKSSPRGFEDIVARVKPAVFGIRARVVDEQASADDQAAIWRDSRYRGTLARRRARGPAFLSPPMATR